MKPHLRPTTESDLNFVVRAEQREENCAFIGSSTREQHVPALDAEDFRHLVIEDEGGKRVGYIILAGLTDANDSVEFRRIVVTKKNEGYGKQAQLRVID